MAANQEATRSWWESLRPGYDLFISTIVTQEASGGNPDAAKRRVAAIEGLPELDIQKKSNYWQHDSLQVLHYRTMRRLMHCILPLPQFMVLTICSLGTANTLQTQS